MRWTCGGEESGVWARLTQVGLVWSGLLVQAREGERGGEAGQGSRGVSSIAPPSFQLAGALLMD